MDKIKDLEGKKVAIVGLGRSWFDFALAKTNGTKFDEVWAINAVGNVIYHDRVFMMDPASRFFDSDDAGFQTDGAVEMLTNHQGPIYTCEVDERCPGHVAYPIKEVLEETNCHYLNNTVAYAIAFAFWNKVGALHLFGIDFGYKGNLYFAEAGRACCEYWLALCMKEGIEVGVAHSSFLLDTAIPDEEKLYGYHRLDDPLIPKYNQEKNKIVPIKKSEEKTYWVEKPTFVDRNTNNELSAEDINKAKINEPKKW